MSLPAIQSILAAEQALLAKCRNGFINDDIKGYTKAMLKILAIDHVVFRTTKLEAMLQFYCDILGCAIERDQLNDNGLVQLRAGLSLIDLVKVDSKLGQLGGKAPQQDGRNVDHVCLQIAAITQDKLKQYLAQHQIEHSEFALRYGAVGLTESIYIEDPEQNVIELKPLID